MPERAVLELRLDDHLRLRKPHPCGSRTWRVVRLGADIGLVCDGCGRRVLLERRRVEQRLVEFLERGPERSPVEVPESAASLADAPAAGSASHEAAGTDTPGGRR